MTRRFNALATTLGLAAALTISPALAAENNSPPPDSTTPPETQPAPATTTTTAPPAAPDDQTPPGATCEPTQKVSMPAPAVGTQETYQADEAGAVTVARTGEIELTIVTATPNSGWANGTQTPTGSRVAARFYEQATTHVVRFVAELNRTGTSLYLRTTHCHKPS